MIKTVKMFSHKMADFNFNFNFKTVLKNDLSNDLSNDCIIFDIYLFW